MTRFTLLISFFLCLLSCKSANSRTNTLYNSEPVSRNAPEQLIGSILTFVADINIEAGSNGADLYQRGNSRMDLILKESVSRNTARRIKRGNKYRILSNEYRKIAWSPEKYSILELSYTDEGGKEIPADFFVTICVSHYSSEGYGRSWNTEASELDIIKLIKSSLYVSLAKSE